MSEIIRYRHHDRWVAVMAELKDLQDRHCLCHQDCMYFKPDEDDNCPINKAVRENHKKYGIIAPVWECPKFKQDDKKREAPVDRFPDEILDQLKQKAKEDFMAECMAMFDDLDAKYRGDLLDLAERAKEPYLQYAKCLLSGQELDDKTKQRMELQQAQLAQYEAIVALKLDEQFKQIAQTTLKIVIAAAIAGAIKAIAF